MEKALRILVVDDHPLARAGVRAGIMATFPAARVEEAGSAPEALARISSRKPDLVLLGVNLPGENGIDLARRIHAAHKDIKLLMVTGEVDPWTVNEAIGAGANGFVTKMHSTEYLGRAVKRILNGQAVLSSDAAAALQRFEQRPATASEPPGPAILSEREREVLKYLAHGENTKTIARALLISPKTVETHRLHIINKLGISSIAAMTRYAIRHGLTRP